MMKIENWTIEEQTGYKPMTTFYMDFSIADKFGVKAIQDTYDRSFKSWNKSIEYMTELVMVLNWKCWRWNEVNEDYCELYRHLYYKLDEWVYNNFAGKDLEYYIRVTD